MTTYIIKQLVTGARFARKDELPLSFTRSSAALAALIDYLNARGVKAIYSEADTANAGCYDIIADFGGNAEQWMIEPEGTAK
jgi:hypothetical protein